MQQKKSRLGRGTGALGSKLAGDSRSGGDQRWKTALFALAILVVAVSPAVAFGEGAPASENDAASPFVMTPQLIQEAASAGGAMSSDPSVLTDPGSADELPHDDLNRGEVIQLAETVFEPALEATGGLVGDLPEARFLDNYTAVVSAAALDGGTQSLDETGSDSALIESSVPLRAEADDGQMRPVDFALERDADGTLEPKNPLVPAELPSMLGDGISLGNGLISLSFSDLEQQPSPSVLEGDLALYPNVQEDSDVLVTAIPGGVETMTQLRTAEAPRHQTIDLELPDGSVLEGNESGGAQVELNGRILLNIPPPTAIDASGQAVPMTMAAAGSSIELEVITSKDTVYPVLADPLWLFEKYNWTWGGSSFAGWETSNTAPGYRALEWAYPSPSVRALDLTSGYSGGATPNTGAQWYYLVPRYHSDQATYGQYPDSWIEKVYLEGAMFHREGNNATYPLMIAGILDPFYNSWISVGSHNGAEGDVDGWSGNYEYPNHGNTHGKLFSFGLITLETEAQAKYRNALAAMATVELHDGDTPQINELAGPSGWWNTGEPLLTYAVSDAGLGVRTVQLAPPGGETASYSVGCTGGNSSPCPRSYKSSQTSSAKVPVKVGSASEGQSLFTFSVADALYPAIDYGKSCCEEVFPHRKSESVKIKIDHSAPTLGLTGSLTQQATLGTTQAHYTLKYSATDGIENPPTLVSSFGTEGTGNVQFKQPADAARQSDGALWVSDRNNNRVEKIGEKGEFLGVIPTPGSSVQLNKPSGVELDAAGNLWVVDSGNNQLQKFTNAGSLVQKVGTAGSGNGQFSAPQGIAIAPNGNLYVADTGNNRIQRFSASGTFISAFGFKGSAAGQFNEPMAVDVGPDGRVWVADAGNNRVEVFNEQGEFLAAYGGLGSGNGQLNRPAGIEVDARGSVWVVDQNNGRVEQFSERGEYLGQFGVKGSAAGQFNWPLSAGITTNSAGSLWVVDSGNNRVQRWNAPEGTRSGLRSVVIKVDGKEVQQGSVTCPQGGCPMSGEWTLHSGEYTAGAHAVEVVATDGVSLSTTEKLAITLNPPAPSVALSGSVTEQAALGTTLPRYGLKVDASALQGSGSSEVQPTYVNSLGGSGTTGAELKSPTDAVIASNGNVWVVDQGNNRVVVFNEAGAFVREVGGLGSTGGKLNKPSAIAIDSVGTVDVTDTANNRVAQYYGSGAFIQVIGANVNKTKVEAGAPAAERNRCTAASGDVCQAGTAGTGDGQMAEPVGITTNLGQSFYVVERANNRVEKFSTQGEYLAKFGTPGSNDGQLKEPTAISYNGSLIWVADTGNNRMQGFTTSFVFSRKFSTEGSISGQMIKPAGVEIDSFGNLWVSDQGNKRVQKFGETGAFLLKFGTAGTQEGQLASPAGIASDTKGNLYIADPGNNRLHRWRQTRSQVSSVITVDGKPVDSGEARCIATETCPITREWFLDSSSYAAGLHNVVAKATDGYGYWTSKSRIIEIRRDTTKPTLDVAGELVNAPEGWVQQDSYGLNATATDQKGYGVTSLTFKVDGKAVLSTSKSCADGSCSASLTGSVGTESYEGGAMKRKW